MPENIADVVIVGGGPNGLMLAAELALGGVRPLVLERLTEPSVEPKANGLVGHVVRLLDMRGLYQRFGADVRIGSNLPGYLTAVGSSAVPRPMPGYQFSGLPLKLNFDSNPMYVLPIPQPKLVRQLARRAIELGVEIRWGHELIGVTHRPDGVAATICGPDGVYRLDGSFLVAADGGRSAVRKLLDVDFPGFTSDSVTRLGHVRVPDELRNAAGGLDVPGLGSLRFGHNRLDRGTVAFAELEPGRPLLSVTEYGTDTADGNPVTFAELRAAAARVLGAELPLEPPDGPGPHALRRIAGQNTRLVDSYRVGHVLLLGDAAHVHSAMGGPGLNLGLQDAVNLGWKLAAVVQGRAPQGLLDTYQSERHPVGERVMMHSLAQTALVRPGPEAGALRDLFGELLELPAVAAHIAQLLAGSDVRYETGCDHPLAGRPAPELTLTTDGETRRLAELLHRARPVYVGSAGDPATRAVTDGWADRVDTVIAQCPDTVAAALLIRPDGYVAWAADTPGAADGLADALTRWFGPRAQQPNTGDTLGLHA